MPTPKLIPFTFQIEIELHHYRFPALHSAVQQLNPAINELGVNQRAISRDSNHVGMGILLQHLAWQTGGETTGLDDGHGLCGFGACAIYQASTSAWCRAWLS